MSIKEAIQRVGSRSDERQSTRGWVPYGENQGAYNKAVLEKGSAILQEANIPALFKELADILRPDFQDVRIDEPKRYGDGSVGLELGWGFRPANRGGLAEYLYNAVSVFAYPLTGVLVVGSEDGVELLEKSEWISDPKKVEDAIVRSSKNPINKGGPEIDMRGPSVTYLQKR